MVERLTVVLYTVFQYSRKSIGRWFDSGHSDFVLNTLAKAARPSLSFYLRSILSVYCLSMKLCRCKYLQPHSLHGVTATQSSDLLPCLGGLHASFLSFLHTILRHRQSAVVIPSVLDETQPTAVKNKRWITTRAFLVVSVVVKNGGQSDNVPIAFSSHPCFRTSKSA